MVFALFIVKADKSLYNIVNNIIYCLNFCYLMQNIFMGIHQKYCFFIYNARRNNRNKFRRKKVNFETHIIIIIKFHQIPKEQFPMPLSNSQMYNLTYTRYRIDSHEEHT